MTASKRRRIANWRIQPGQTQALPKPPKSLYTDDMADNKKSLPANVQKVGIQVNVPPDLRAAKYANLVNIDTSDNEVTLDFIYVNQRDNPNGTLVSRVVVARSMLKRMTDSLVEITERVERDAKSE